MLAITSTHAADPIPAPRHDHSKPAAGEKPRAHHAATERHARSPSINSRCAERFEIVFLALHVLFDWNGPKERGPIIFEED
jgi:hypothetical protein